MKKLMTLCFVILFTVLAVLSFINYSSNGVDMPNDNEYDVLRSIKRQKECFEENGRLSFD